MPEAALDLLVRDIDELLTLDHSSGEGVLGRIVGGSIGFREGQVAWIGPSTGAPEAEEIVDGAGCVGLPGLVDCHTHALYAGSRAAEFGRRLAGTSYTEILEAGGGILSTVRATRAASDDTLRALLAARLEGALRRGVTTVEVKTGYGLSIEHELRHLRLLAAGPWPVRVVPTFLGAHTVPAERRSDRDTYVREVVEAMIPAAAALGAGIDVYCDRGAFTCEEAERILSTGLALGMIGHLHAEQVSHTGAAALAARLGCASAEHLERIDDAGIAALAAAGTVGVLLPGARLYLRDPAPPVAAMREAGVSMAVATDLNPGSSPVRDLWTCATLACLDMALTMEEAIVGITRNAGRALGRPDLGWLGVGSAADLALIRPPPGEPARYQVLLQYLGGHSAAQVVRGGRLVRSQDGQ